MTDMLGEDRLLDLTVVEEWMSKADAAMEHAEHWVDDELPELEPEDLTQVRDELRRSLGREKGRSTWLARLCARVRHLEAERDAATDLHDEAMLTLRETEDERDELRAEGHRLREKLLSSEAASQRLTEALRVIAEYNVGANHGAIDEWTESAAFHDCKKLAQVTLGAGAPPEGEQ